jgi:hypothetical protein
MVEQANEVPVPTSISDLHAFYADPDQAHRKMKIIYSIRDIGNIYTTRITYF